MDIMGRKNNSKLLIINYHYIRSKDQYPYSGIHPIEAQAFLDQVKWLKDRFHIATPEEVESFAVKKIPLPDKSIFLTFDDGLIEHEMVVRDILNPLGIRGAFFIASRPFLEGRALMVHKIHWLRATTHPDEFYEVFMSMLPKNLKDKNMDETSTGAALKTYIYDTPQDARLKYLINFLLPAELVDRISSEMLIFRRISEDDFCNQVYMNESQILKLVEGGQLVGSHGYTHTVFSNLKNSVLEEELHLNISHLEGITGIKPRWISYPYGTIQSIPANMDKLCKKFGFIIGLTLDKERKRWNSGVESPYRLGRVNSNHLKELCI